MLVALGSCSPGAAEVVIDAGQRFDPTNITVDVGDSVVFTNDSSQAHTVTAYEDRIPGVARYFSSGGFEHEELARKRLQQALLEPGESYEVTFRLPGTYHYFCIPHEAQGMTGVVIVRG